MDTDNNDSTQPALEDIASFDVNELFRSQSETSQRSPVSYSSTGESASRNDNNEEKSDLEESYANTSCSASIPPLHTVPSVFFQRNKHVRMHFNYCETCFRCEPNQSVVYISMHPYFLPDHFFFFFFYIYCNTVTVMIFAIIWSCLPSPTPFFLFQLILFLVFFFVCLQYNADLQFLYVKQLTIIHGNFSRETSGS